MNIINFLLILLWGLIVPFILGYQIDTCYSKDRISYVRCLLFGYVVYCASFQLIAPEFIVTGGSFSTVFLLWIVLVIAIVAATLFINRKTFLSRIIEPIKNLDKIKCDWVGISILMGAILFIAFHTLLIGYMMHFDTDDARFVAEALEAYEKNTLLSYNPITGEFIGGPIGEMCKDTFAPYPIFMAVYGKLFGLTPAIATHTVLPFIYIPMCYMAFWLIAKKILKNDVKNTAIALFLFAVINTFSMETIFSFGWVLLALIWQGRSFLCTVMIPLVLYILITFITEIQLKKVQYIILMVCGIACGMLSGMGFMLMLLMVAAFAFVALLVRKELKTSILMMISMLPTAVYFILYTSYSGKM